MQFERLTTADGLLSDQVYTLHEDNKGYIWACTNYGIVKYNGTNFIPVCTNIPFKESLSYCMYENSKGELWFANSQANIYEIKRDSAIYVEGFESIREEIYETASDINKIILNNSHDIFVSTSRNSYKFLKNGNKKVIDLNENLKKEDLDFIVIQSDQECLIVKQSEGWPSSHKKFRCKIVDEKLKGNKLSIEIKNKQIVRLATIINNSVYLTAGNELIKILPDGSTQNTLFSNVILSISSDKENNVWLGLYQDGLYKVSSTGKILEHYFSEVTINNILFDDQSGLWISTSGQGIYYCKSIYDYAYTNLPGLTQSVGMIKKIDSMLFVGTYGGKLFKINQYNIPEEINLNGLTYSMIGDIVKTENGYLIACKDAFLKADLSFHNIKKIFTVADVPATGLLIAQNSNRELFTLSRTSLNKYKKNQIISICNIPSKAYSLLYLENDTFLIGSSKGLYMYDGNKLSIPSYLNQFKDILITKLIKSGNGDVWICTLGNGLHKLKKDKQITGYTNLPANAVHDIFFLNDSSIILSLNSGVYTFPKNKINDFKAWQQLHHEESTISIEFNNRLFISTNTGLISLSLKNVKTKIPSKLYFNKIVLNDTVIAIPPFRFTHQQKKIEFYFDNLDFKINKTQLRYKLDGEINETGIIQGTKVTLAKLPPGKYKLTVISATHSVFNNKKGIVINFIIEPAFWQTVWFKILIITFGIIVLVFIIYLFNLRTKNKERQKIKIIRRLAEYKLTALKAQINPHFISNSLSAIQQLILDDNTDKAAQYLAKFSLLIRYVLKYSDKALVKLSEELEVINLNIELESLRFKDGFEIEKKIAEDINPENISVPPLITQPFIENAIWHGLLPLKGIRKPKLKIHIEKRNEELLICIEDNGVGRNNEKNNQRESHGTQLISNRLDNINLLHGTKTAMMSFEDLFNENLKPVGTRVHITLPINSEYEED